MINKINPDPESIRHQKNMTKTQKRNDMNIKEGIVVNSFVKDPLLSLDETYDSLVISKHQVELPSKLEEKENNEKQREMGKSAFSLLCRAHVFSFAVVLLDYDDF